MRYCLVAFKNFTKELVCYETLKTMNSNHLGCLVEVKYGKQTKVGMIVEFTSSSNLPLEKIKKVVCISHAEPLLSTKNLEFLKKIAQYYLLSLNELVLLAIQPSLSLTDLSSYHVITSLNEPTQSKTQGKILSFCEKPRCIWELRQYFMQNTVDTLLKEKKIIITHPAEKEPVAKLLPLTQRQQAIYQSIIQKWQHTHLIHGVTGSGKTEIYAHLIMKTIKDNQQALLLVPEIALTNQTAKKIEARCDTEVVIIHSELTPKQRSCRWMRAKTGSAKIILGTRSALLCDFKNLGMIIVDEEHDSSYRHHSPLFFSARDMSVLKGHLESIPVILGSATPSLESMLNAQKGRYVYHTLFERMNTQMPNIHLLEHKTGDVLHPTIHKAIEHTLIKKKNALVFIGRRGWSNLLYCLNCQWKATCEVCNSNLILHEDQRLHCHQCSTKFKYYTDCPSCEQAELTSFGLGSQQVKHALSKLWPEHQVLRFDTDQNTTELRKQFDALPSYEATILVGTQMMTKGHDIASIETVVIIQADQGLYAHNFRANENVFAELIQTAGRCGRNKSSGTVWIQAKQTNHEVFDALVHSPMNYYQVLLDQRKSYHLPPYTYHTVVYFLIPKIDEPWLKKLISSQSLISAQGPLPMLKGNRQKKYCFFLLMTHHCRSTRHQEIQSFLQYLAQHQKPKWEYWWQIDSHFCP